jgi:hypothetical protein
MIIAGQSPSEQPPSFGRVAPPRAGSGVSPWWRAIAIILVVLLVVLGLSLALYKSPTSTTTLTKVEWSHYEIPGGPEAEVNESNTTEIGAGHFCAPPSAVTAGIFSMVWAASTDEPVQQVVLWALYPPNSTYPLGYPVVLYEASNASSGGSSFVPFFPAPCGYTWNIGVKSPESVIVYVVATLTYNYTAPTPTL